MIRIIPYYELESEKQEEILDQYLRMVADSVPFFPEDVLYDRNEKVTDRMRKPRKRTPKYESKMKDYFTSGLPKEDSADEKRKNDAVLAEKIIEKYSPDLHKKLYNGHSDGHVDHEVLRALLTVCMPGGVLDDTFDFYHKDNT